MSRPKALSLFRFTLKSDIVDIPLWLFGRGVRGEIVSAVDVEPGVIVDVMTGTGSILLEYARRFPDARIVAVDRDVRVLDVARARLEKAGYRSCETVVADARDMPLAGGIADVVNLSFCLHENPGEARGLILRECLRVMKPAGRLVVADYREVQGCEVVVASPYLRLFEPGWVGELFYGGLERQVEQAGFELKSVRADLPFTRLIIARARRWGSGACRAGSASSRPSCTDLPESS